MKKRRRRRQSVSVVGGVDLTVERFFVKWRGGDGTLPLISSFSRGGSSFVAVSYAETISEEGYRRGES